MFEKIKIYKVGKSFFLMGAIRRIFYAIVDELFNGGYYEFRKYLNEHIDEQPTSDQIRLVAPPKGLVELLKSPEWKEHVARRMAKS